MDSKITSRRTAAQATLLGYRKDAQGVRRDVHDPIFNLREIAKNLILLEDHLSHQYKICPDCIRKHLLCIEGLAEEGTCLDGDGEYTTGMEGLAELARQWMEEFTDGAEPFSLACKMRAVRKSVVPLSFDPRGATERVASIHAYRKNGCSHR